MTILVDKEVLLSTHSEKERLAGELLTIDEVAAILDVSPVTIHRYKKQRGLPYIKIGSTVRFDKNKLWEWVMLHERSNLA